MKRILLIDEDRVTVDLVTAFVNERSNRTAGGGLGKSDVLQLQLAEAGEPAIHKVKAWKPHVVLLAADDAHGVATAELVRRIRGASPDEYAAIAVLHEDPEAPTAVAALEAGADDFLGKPLVPPLLSIRLRALTHLKDVQDSVRRGNHRLDEMANTDEVTGLLNMRALLRRGEEEIGWASRFRKPVSAILVNLDGLSTVNRDHGFPFGTYAIQETARRIKTCLRTIDFAARVGADEFFVLLKETDLAGAEFVAERIREAIQSEEFRHERTACKVTACLGVAGFGPDGGQQKMSDLLHIVSEAMGSAKQAGRDRIEVYSFG